MRKLHWTERKALEVCRDLWQWLADNPDKRKQDWLGWKRNGGKIPRCLDDCPVCQYDTLHEDCNYCLLWGEGKELKGKDCLDTESPYWRWHFSKDSTVRKAAALEIVAACNRALAKLKKE